ncbi:MAG: tRNA pseudouridine(55) synthase TruB [Christensenellaceae bacterium]|jgi:tRNA pseudouridine55 synthase|nr:tRNA pseudouridine(55) synthase TruB [Christensenellaceae bacterium]
MIGIVVINKDKGFTSNDAVVKIKKLTGQKRVGHLGTLDPMATGVLPVCLGKATRLFDRYLKKTKTYAAHFRFGMLTDTLDSEGVVLQKNGKIPDRASILEVLDSFRGKIMQIPPKYSAKNIGGVRAYKLARLGEEVELAPRQVEVFKLELLGQIDDETFEFEIECSAGTYIRSLGRDIGEALDTCAVMTKLTRTRCGEFELKDALPLEGLTKQKIENNLVSLESALKDLPQMTLTGDEFKRLMSGLKLMKSDSGEYLILFEKKVVGIGNVTNGAITLTTNLYED